MTTGVGRTPLGAPPPHPPGRAAGEDEPVGGGGPSGGGGRPDFPRGGPPPPGRPTPSNPRERAASENQPFRASDTTFFAASWTSARCSAPLKDSA